MIGSIYFSSLTFYLQFYDNLNAKKSKKAPRGHEEGFYIEVILTIGDSNEFDL